MGRKQQGEPSPKQTRKAKLRAPARASTERTGNEPGNPHYTMMPGFQPRSHTPDLTPKMTWGDRVGIGLMIGMPCLAGGIVGFLAGEFAAVTFPLWAAILTGVIFGIATVAILFTAYKDSCGLIFMPVLVIVMALILYPVFIKVRTKAHHAALRGGARGVPLSRPAPVP